MKNRTAKSNSIQKVCLDFSNLKTITPSEYSKYIYIGMILKVLLKEKITSCCDIGCGTGSFLSLLTNCGITPKGIDISEESISIANVNLSHLNVRFEKKDIFELNEEFDLIFLLDVLEHFRDDDKLLNLLHQKIVRRGKFLILSVPAHRFLYSYFDRSVGHYRRYDKKSLISFLERNGFKPIIFWSYGSIIFHIIANLSVFSRWKETNWYTKTDMQEKTRRSAIREFPTFFHFFVSRINFIHCFFFLFDYIFKNCDMGIGYCVLCKSIQK